MNLGELGNFYKWSDLKLITLLKPISDDVFSKIPEQTNKSLRKLVEHMVVYYEILNKRSKFGEISERVKKLSKDELISLWQESVSLLPETLAKRKFDDIVDFRIDKDTSIKISNFQEVFAYTDHATYHRGQIITTYKFLTGKEAIGTDYYGFMVSQLKK